MTIRNLSAYIDGLWDWAMLDGCFGTTKIKPTDIDGCIERNGQTLILETKKPGKDIPRGQQIMFESWAKTGLFTIIVLWGETNKPEAMMVFRPAPYPHAEKRRVTAQEFREQVDKWYRWANGQKATR